MRALVTVEPDGPEHMTSATTELASTFTWLAYSEREQREAQDLASSLSERETRDELGVGSIRDALADRLFPGTSTIQSRARYFLFVPWIFQILEREHAGQSRERADRLERRLAAALRRSSDTAGLVGAQKLNVMRLPSSIYWNGLGVLGIRRYPIALSDYYRWLDDPHRPAHVVVDDDGMPLAGEASTIWETLPSAPEGFLDEAEFRLSHGESRFLQARTEAATPHRMTMLRLLFAHGRVDAARSDFPWNYPWTRRDVSRIPDEVREELDVAELFSLGLHGAALLFNLLIAEARGEDERQDAYKASLAAWQGDASPRLATFDLARLWALMPVARPTLPTRTFVEKWFEVVRTSDGAVDADQRARELVRRREVRIKGRLRSRIANPHRVAWNGASGSGRLDYRWGTVQQMALDVAEGRSRA
jgi:hypothetical protein